MWKQTVVYVLIINAPREHGARNSHTYLMYIVKITHIAPIERACSITNNNVAFDVFILTC